MWWQQEHVLTELFEYTTREPPPPDRPSVQQTLAYLQACNSIFERGIIGKQAYVRSMTSPVIKNIDSGFKFFSTWADSLLCQGRNYNESFFLYALPV